jgi:hypothetical protein
MYFSRRLFSKLVIAALFSLSSFFPCAAVQQKQSAPLPLRVLFIGNSYTYFNNLPEIVTRLADYGHQRKLETRMVAPGGWRLKDHWEQGEALNAVREGHWDYVVLQEQSTLGVNYYLEGKPRIAGDEAFKPYAEKWAAEILKTGAIPVFYLAWARKATPEDQAALNYAYISAAKENGARIAPVGIAWAQARQQQPALELYYTDGSHPSPAGSYLAGCVIYAALFHRSPVGLPGKVSGIPVNLNTARAEPEKSAVLVDLPADQAQILQAAAWSAAQKFAREGNYPKAPPQPLPVPAPLPAGSPLSGVALEGTWTGSLLLYPPPYLPLEMVLELHRDGADWKGHLELKTHDKHQIVESIDLDDLMVSQREFSFTDPKAMQNLRVRFRGVSTRANELRGIADAASESPTSPARLLGTWSLHKK